METPNLCLEALVLEWEVFIGKKRKAFLSESKIFPLNLEQQAAPNLSSVRACAGSGLPPGLLPAACLPAGKGLKEPGQRTRG